jgi:hypothetical protein
MKLLGRFWRVGSVRGPAQPKNLPRLLRLRCERPGCRAEPREAGDEAAANRIRGEHHDDCRIGHPSESLYGEPIAVRAVCLTVGEGRPVFLQRERRRLTRCGHRLCIAALTIRGRRDSCGRRDGDQRPRQQGIQFGHVACDDGSTPSRPRSPITRRGGVRKKQGGAPWAERSQTGRVAFARWGGAMQGGNDARIEVER